MILLDNTVGIIGFMSILKMASYVDIRNGVYKKKNDYILFFLVLANCLKENLYNN